MTARYVKNFKNQQKFGTKYVLVTGKAVTLPGLTIGNMATESLTDSEAVQRTMELLSQTTHEF